MPGNDRPIIIAAPDSFKGSCSAADAALAILAGAREVYGENAEYVAIPLADGGEGTLDAMLAAWGVNASFVQVHDALGRPRTARYGISSDCKIALIEAAEANGLPWVSDEPLQPLDADTYGVGEIVLDALSHGVNEILLCVGGSATNDGGTGMLRALGAQFFDENNQQVLPGARGLAQVARVDTSEIDPRALSARWRIAVDVQFPLCGDNGAAAVFGPQKGATPEDISVIDTGLAHLAGVLATKNDIAVSDYTERKGFGAAGGIPLTAVAMLNAEMIAGGDLVSDALSLPDKLANAALIFTGEGQLDAQSLSGKVVDLVSRNRPSHVPLVVIAGSVALTARECREAGITAAFSIAPGPITFEQLIESTTDRLSEVAAQAAALTRGYLNRGFLPHPDNDVI